MNRFSALLSNSIQFILPALLTGLLVVLLGCPTAAPEAKKKGGGDDGGEEPYVCPKAQPITETPKPSVGDTTGNAALQALVDAAITVGNPSPDLNHIDTSKVTNMSGIFSNEYTFNGDVSCWNTSNVENMNTMFSGAKIFNGDISKWNTGMVTNMNTMFNGANKFNGDISGWDTGNVSIMNAMFANATVFNQDLSGWNVKSVPASNHPGFALLSGFKDDTAKHPKWCDNVDADGNPSNRHASCSP